MAQVPYRANLSSKSFPLLPSKMARTVIVPYYDQNFNRQIASRADADKDVGIAQAYYMRNVLPTEEGFTAVAYKTRSTITSSYKNFDQIVTIGDEAIDGYVYATNDLNTPAGKVRIYSIPHKYVVDVSPLINFVLEINNGAIVPISVATVNGRMFLNAGDNSTTIYEFNSDLTTLTSVALTVTGYTGRFRGILSSYGYLVAYTADTIFWSSPGNPTDFVPSLATGAGQERIQQARGPIIRCEAITAGFIVYCRDNIILARYSGNSRFPFTFVEIYNSAGIVSYKDVATEANAAQQFAFTSAGLVQIVGERAELVFPDLTSFFAANTIEESSDGLTFTKTTGVTFYRRLSFVHKRFLIVSYGTSTQQYLNSAGTFPVYSHALVYDTVLQRWGKLAVDHVAIYSAELYTQTGIDTLLTDTQYNVFSNARIGLMTPESVLKEVSLDPAHSPSGLLVLGKYQLSRTRLTQLDGIEIENIDIASPPLVKVAYSLDGRNTLQYLPTLELNQGNLSVYKASIVGMNHSIIINGAFNLNTVLLRMHNTGVR